MNFLVRIASAPLHCSLAMYPARYRREYGDEHACVLQLALDEAAADGWYRLLQFCAREWRDLPLALLREHSKEWRLWMEANGNPLEGNQEPGYTLWAGLFPFLLLGLMALAFEVPREWGNEALFQSLRGLLMFGGYLVIMVGLLFGALAGFPPWALPYLIYGIVFALYIANASTPGLVVFNIEMWGRDIWGFRACVPLGIVVLLVARLNRHPWELVDKLRNGVAKDWPRLTFGLYGLFPLLVFISFDEMDNLYSFPGAMLGLALIIIGAFFYLHLKSPFWRTFSMVVFAFLGMLAVKAITHFYWDTHYVNLITGERRLLEGPVSYGGILAKAVRDTLGAILFLMLPGIGKVLGFINHLAQSITKRLQRSG